MLPFQAHQEIVLDSLKDADISIRKRALDLLYVMTDSTNADIIVTELVDVRSPLSRICIAPYSAMAH
jgi:AP-2 complex subunit alpha